MPLRKTAIALPEDLLVAIDRAGNERGESRNRVVMRVFQQALRARRDAAVTRRLNELFADEGLRSDHSREAAELDAVGTAVDHER